MKGKRIMPVANGYLPPLSAGDYGRIDQKLNVNERLKQWQGVAPDGSGVSLNPKIHEVFEYDDGTITVRPSIVTKTWHGWLKKGVWESV